MIKLFFKTWWHAEMFKCFCYTCWDAFFRHAEMLNVCCLDRLRCSKYLVQTCCDAKCFVRHVEMFKLRSLLLVFVFEMKIQDPRSKIQDPRSKIQDPRSKVQGPRSKIQDPRSKIQDQIRDQRSKIQDPRSKIQDPRSITWIRTTDTVKRICRNSGIRWNRWGSHQPFPRNTSFVIYGCYISV